MPNQSLAREALASYEEAITNAVSELEAPGPEEGTYGWQAVQAWKDCIRD